MSLLRISREEKLRRVERKLADAVWRWEEWSFANSPSQDEDEKNAIYRLIRKVEELGGDALDVVSYRSQHMVADAMPDAFERRRNSHGNGWTTYRRVVEAGPERAKETATP